MTSPETDPRARPDAPRLAPAQPEPHTAKPLSALSHGQRIAGYVLLAVVMGAVAAMSWSGLFGFARVTMGWTPVHAALVPIALDIAAISCAFLALDSVQKGELASGYRIMAAALVGLSAFVNWRHSLTSHNISEQVFFPAMSILSYGLIHLTLGKYRRDSERQRAGQIAREPMPELPRLGLAIWLPFIGYPLRATRAVRASLARRLPEAPGPDDETRRQDRASGLLAGLTQADAIRTAMDEIGAENPREVVAWLAAHGWPEIPTSRVHDVIRRDGVKAVPEITAGPEGHGEAPAAS
jgi:Protein of unknown function (DUF2637)